VDLTFIFHIFSTIGFGLAQLLAVRIQKNLLGHPARTFLSLFLLIYFLVGVTNILKHGGINTYFDRFEYFTEVLFPPAFLFFIFPIFSLYIFPIYMKQDFEIGSVRVAHNITKLKRMQNELEATRSFLQSIIDGY